jgi:hypothetical protein
MPSGYFSQTFARRAVQTDEVVSPLLMVDPIGKHLPIEE